MRHEALMLIMSFCTSALLLHFAEIYSRRNRNIEEVIFRQEADITNNTLDLALGRLGHWRVWLRRKKRYASCNRATLRPGTKGHSQSGEYSRLDAARLVTLRRQFRGAARFACNYVTFTRIIALALKCG